ncbi:polygalacturonase inhibitor [Brachypodium distachyon]|uniref:Leucine-rich repeat-containing N-terminal plant-type domain-containing protein n=1 Tax=Brachypodium distachyon TaxID=15368 RepID=I1HLP9_BRADI|nr:polygalacturonase inhibitor [Brachypodium distachyon]KQK07443.1 hypothetical protein BRADI_2g35490v3 [Brachypodium distachyon]|eukprot:XP_003566540.1 polygalacturonase inhibitor [Brachypodium distachyon]
MRKLVVVFFLCSLLSATATAEPSPDPTNKDCHPGDKSALLAVKSALGNAYHFASWTPSTPCCDWYNIHCSPTTGRVVSLAVFQDANLTGTIPNAIAGLAHLETLVLHHLPALSGPIPPAVGKLSNLSSLTVSWTAVSGPVPAFLAALKKLTFLDLSFNSLTGNIPAALGTVPGLSGINLSRNRLTGPIPAALLGNNSSADQVYLWMSHNNLTGPIPAEFAAVRFAHLDLSRNGLTGSGGGAAGLFGQGKELQYLDLSRNALDFDLSAVVFPDGIYFLDVSHNAIRGGIPAQVADLGNLQFFNVSYNRLCGQVPAGGNMERLDVYNFQHNKCLCGAPLAPCKKL